MFTCAHNDTRSINHVQSATPGFVRVHIAAKRLGLQPRTVRWLIKKGRLGAVKSGPRIWRVSETDLAELVRKRVQSREVRDA